jgi:NAD(P)H-hydrate repair Nnr-like enzyme with NAD(P)H-hydrate epimerase domain
MFCGGKPSKLITCVGNGHQGKRGLVAAEQLAGRNNGQVHEDHLIYGAQVGF